MSKIVLNNSFAVNDYTCEYIPQPTPPHDIPIPHPPKSFPPYLRL